MVLVVFVDDAIVGKEVTRDILIYNDIVHSVGYGAEVEELDQCQFWLDLKLKLALMMGFCWGDTSRRRGRRGCCS